jgi:Pro-kumamolisin, activation domain
MALQNSSPGRRRRLAQCVSVTMATALPVLMTGGISSAAPQPMVRDASLAAAPVAAGHAYLGATKSGAVKFEVVMAPSAPAALKRFVSEVSSPRDALYHHYLSERQFAARFGPRRTVVKQAAAWLRGDGFSVSRTSTFVLQARGSVADVRSLGLSLARYRGPSGAEGTLPQGLPVLPSALAGGEVSGIVGLDTLDRPQHLGARPVHIGHNPASPALPSTPLGGAAQAAVQGSACAAAAQAAAQAGAYTVDQMGPHYDLDQVEATGQDGAHTTVALPEVDPLSSSDITAYDQCFGLQAQAQVVDVDGGATLPLAGEADLDFEELATLAPAASIVTYEGPNTLTGLYDMVDQIVTTDKANVISISLGSCEPGVSLSFQQSMNSLFEEAAAQGESVLAASGDSGSEDCYSYDAQDQTGSGTSLAVDYPASSPLVTAVGGTVITGSGELAWNDCNQQGSIACANQIAQLGGVSYGVGAGGGGVSQSSVSDPGPSGQPRLAGSNGYREVPDVAADSGSNFGDGLEFYIGGQWLEYIGTSLATPIWASLVVDRDSLCSTPTGDFDPALYSLYSSSSADAAAFTPVIKGYASSSSLTPEAGSNDYTQTDAGDYPVTAGYNLVTGVGAPIATGLACSQVTGAYSGQGGQQVTFAGVGLEGATIYFGSLAVKAVSETATTATVVVPTGQGQVTLSASSPVLGSSTAKASFTYTSGGGTTTTTTSSTPTSTTTPAPPSSTTSTVTVTTTSTPIGGPGSGGPGGGAPPGTTTTTAEVASPVTSTTAVPSTTVPVTVPVRAHRLGHGYWLVSRAGQVYTFGIGSSPAAPRVPASEKVVDIAPTPDDNGYWLVTADGRVFMAGDARPYGDVPGLGLAPAGTKGRPHLAAPVVALVPALDGKGYLLVAADGGVFAFGDAGVARTCATGHHCAGAVVAAFADPAASGYWEVTATGHIYGFGHARASVQCTSAVTAHHSAVVAAAATGDGDGYWVLLGDGAVCTAGDARSYPAVGTRAPAGHRVKAVATFTAAAIVPVYEEAGYWVVGADGSVHRFGGAPQEGGPAGHLRAPLVAAAGW